MIKTLSIGNSFSQDSTAYLHDMALCAGIDTKIVNLYIGGCSLSTHWDNAKNDKANYSYELNGKSTGRMVSIRETLGEDKWDFVTLQQSSPLSGFEKSYYPYVTDLSAYIKEYAFGATQLIHETWNFEPGSTHPKFVDYGNDSSTMYRAVSTTYRKVAASLGLGIIPCGDVLWLLQNMKEFDSFKGGQSLYRDGFHLHLIYGRYTAAATFYETMLKGNIQKNPFRPAGTQSNKDSKLFSLISQTVHHVCSE
jgi:hypothetical protein